MLYRFGEFLLCPEEKVLWHGKRHIQLTPKMYELLLAFLEKPGKILEKEYLLRTVWPNSFV
ncbi:transcriptional regulator [Leptolyngbya sp. 7M]|uniref:winged helix-turn-helix domain-containing protein n=1 Tax=Leptolyngbya sp. 7M TaxID=2812896 RepID=UPI001B8BA926|nr:winged helix-turn-helix domain-containing protein [Leptolyngbya sp. 7M]QYO65669.1 winged helix-turn-helix domain-containing protein [Leptolyngbya sp. 7M]